MRKNPKLVLVLLLVVPLIGFAFVPRAVAGHGELNSFIHIPRFGNVFPSNPNSAPWRTMIDSWNPDTSRLIMWWWCDPWEDPWEWVHAGPDGIPGNEDDFWRLVWDPDMPTYNGDDEIVIGFGMYITFDENEEELTQQSAKRIQENIEVRVVIDHEYEVDLRHSPVVYNKLLYNDYEEGWRVYSWRVGTVFRAGELREIIGDGVHSFTFIIEDVWGGGIHTDNLLAFLKWIGALHPDGPDAFRFCLT